MELPEPEANEPNGATESRRAPGWESVRLGLLFGSVYFIQGIGEPNAGLIAQPILSLLKSWGHSAGEIALFWGVMSLPWSIKPLYGLLSDFVPLFGSRRRSYMIVTTLFAVVGFSALYLDPPRSHDGRLLLVMLLVPTVGIAFSDVVIDALMVERGQPLGMTGQLQSIQWAAINVATIATGVIGGWLSQHGRQELGFLICAGATAVSLAIAVFLVREPRRQRPSETLAGAVRILWQTFRTRTVMVSAGFLFLWNFNPFSSSVLYVFMTKEIRLSEQFYGNTTSLFAGAAVVASVAYGFYCRRVSFDWLIHLSIISGVVSTLAYFCLSGPRSAAAVTVVVGFAYMTGSLIQLDLAARVCPPKVAGTVFALLMAVCNISVMLSGAAGGPLYDWMTIHWGSRTAFNVLVALGAAFTSACWLLIPLLRRHAPDSRAD